VMCFEAEIYIFCEGQESCEYTLQMLQKVYGAEAVF
jgi:hypothetical protein